MRISVITPTTDRASLGANIMAVNKLLREGDEHLIIYDTPERPTTQILGSRGRFFHRPSRTSVYGNVQRDLALRLALGDCAVFIDDDDLPNKEGFDWLHQAEPDMNTAYAFRMQEGGQLFLSDHVLTSERPGTCGGPQLVVPIVDDMPQWMANNCREADFYFMEQCRKRFKILVRDELICNVRPR